MLRMTTLVLALTSWPCLANETADFVRFLTGIAWVDVLGSSVTTDPDWKQGALDPFPGWLECPFSKTEGPVRDWLVDLYFDEAKTKHDGNGAKRNIALNRQLPVTNPKREAMPEGVAHPSKSLYEADDKTLRAPVKEWLQIKYRSFLKDKITSHAAIDELVAKKNINYDNIWFFDPQSSRNYRLDFDEMGRPLSPNPYRDQIMISDQGFYMALGQNMAVDNLVTFEHDSKMYAFFNHRNESGHPLAFIAGMVDPGDSSKKEAALRELSEEAGVKLDYKKLETEKRIATAWQGTVAAEARQTRNAWTDSTLYHVHFNSIEDMSQYVTLSDEYDSKETFARPIVDVNFVVRNYLADDANLKMFASHASMLKYALGRFFFDRQGKIDVFFAEELVPVTAEEAKTFVKDDKEGKDLSLKAMKDHSMPFARLHELLNAAKSGDAYSSTEEGT